MSEAWKALDLEGGGLQQANLQLARTLKRRAAAYALLIAFPLGLHRDYLGDRRGAWSYRLLSVACATAIVLGATLPAALVALALVIAALIDLARTDAKVTAINKRLRMQVYLRQTKGAPQGFRGHFVDALPNAIPEQENADGDRRLSFAEQEEMLRRVARSQGKPPA